MGLLEKTRVYCIGHMQYADGRKWREYVTKELTPLGIRIFNPYDKPFLKDVDESEEAFKDADRQLQLGRYDDVAARMKIIRAYDLNLVDRSDFIIAHIIPDVASWGTAEELTWAVRCKKPIFLSCSQGRMKAPLWVFGMFPPKYIYETIEDVVDMIKLIDKGEIKIDSDRWRLLKKELR